MKSKSILAVAMLLCLVLGCKQQNKPQSSDNTIKPKSIFWVRDYAYDTVMKLVDGSGDVDFTFHDPYNFEIARCASPLIYVGTIAAYMSTTELTHMYNVDTGKMDMVFKPVIKNKYAPVVIVFTDGTFKTFRVDVGPWLELKDP